MRYVQQLDSSRIMSRMDTDMFHMQMIMRVNKDVWKTDDQFFVNKIFQFLEVINSLYCQHYWFISKQTPNFREYLLENPDVRLITSLKQTPILTRYSSEARDTFW